MILNSEGTIVAFPIDFNFFDFANMNQIISGRVAPSPPTPTQPEKNVSNVLILTGSKPWATSEAFCSIAGIQIE
ncbi:hypothetical protein D3C77_546600 [compost metagenome]